MRCSRHDHHLAHSVRRESLTNMASSSANTKPVVLVTGCTAGGIGDALCREYGRSQYRVFAALRTPEKIDMQLKTSGVLEGIIKMDVTSDESVTAGVEEVLARAGRIDVLINNAGLNLATGPAVEVPLDRFKGTFDVNVSAVMCTCFTGHPGRSLPLTQYFGLIRVSQAVAKDMTKRRSGIIVNIGSTAGLSPLPFSSAYASSKAAVHALSDVMRIELAPLGVRVLCVAPGRIKSEIGKASLAGITRPPTDSPYYSAIPAMEHRAMYSQSGSPTPSADMARAIRRQTEYKSTSLWARHYLVYGASSTMSWILYFLPAFLRDFLLSRVFKIGLIGQSGKQ